MSERAAIGRTPIPGADPAGASVSQDEDYLELRAEATKDRAFAGDPDWSKVIKLGTEILSTRSKDVTVAAYTCAALANAEGYAGLRDGLQIVHGVLQDHWEAGFPPLPKRLRARVNAIDWLAERCAFWVNSAEAKPAEREAIQECAQVCAELSELADQRFEGAEHGLGELARALRDATERLEADGGAPPAAPGEVAQAPAARADAARPAPAPASGTAGAATASQVEIGSKSDVPLLVRKCATFVREKEPTDALGYRLARIARWAPLKAVPADAESKTQLAGPPAERISGLRSLAERGDWQALLANAEEAFWDAPLWLDAQRYCAEALEGLGGPYFDVLEGVRHDLRSLLERVPGLARLSFSDGTPLADPATQSWIAEAVLKGGGAAPAIAPVVAEGVDGEALEEARREARALAKRRDLPGALARLSAATAANQSARGRFLARLELAVLCAEAGRDRVAAPILEELDGQVERHGLDAWEPALSMRVLQTSYQCHRRLAAAKGADPAVGARAEQLYERICRIDPAAAAALE